MEIDSQSWSQQTIPGSHFSRKSKRSNHHPLVFNNNNVSQTYSQKHLGVILDFKLTFEEHLNNVLAKVNKAVGLLRKLRNILPRTTLVTIYKAFIRPHLDYGDVLYDQAFNNSFTEKLESFQYNACLALTGAIRVRQKKKPIKNWDLSPFEIDAGVESFAFFIRSWKMKILNIYSAWFLPDARYTQREIYITSPLLTQNTTFLKTPFFHQP